MPGAGVRGAVPACCGALVCNPTLSGAAASGSYGGKAAFFLDLHLKKDALDLKLALHHSNNGLKPVALLHIVNWEIPL